MEKGVEAVVLGLILVVNATLAGAILFAMAKRTQELDDRRRQ